MAEPSIALRGVRVHNLQGIDVEVPLGRFTALTGVSGAGKSSLLFDTLYAEAQRRYLQSFSVAIRQQLERFDQPDAESIGDVPVAIAVRSRRARDAARMTVGGRTEIADYVRLLLARAGTVTCTRCGQAIEPAPLYRVLGAVQAQPPGQAFSIVFPNRPEPGQDVAAWAADLREEGFTRLQVGSTQVRLDQNPLVAIPDSGDVWVIVDRLEADKATTDRVRGSLELAFSRGQGRLALLIDDATQVFDQRWRCPRCDLPCPEPTPRLFDRDDPLGACPHCQGSGVAATEEAGKGRGRRKSGVVEAESGRGAVCPVCNGRRWNEQALAVRLSGMNIAELSTMPLQDLTRFVAGLPAVAEIEPLLEQLRRRLGTVNDCGLGYLHLQRSLASLATGEWKRLELCTVLNASLLGALYLLDEPAAGLHAGEVPKLITQLQQLRDAGNTVVAIAHHAALIQAADHVIDLGPGAGEEGGRVVAAGPPATLAAVEDSVTADFLSGRVAMAVPQKRRRPQAWLQVRGAKLHNLQDLALDVPFGVFCAVTGVSGAGKSSLIVGTLYPYLAMSKAKKLDAEPPDGAAVLGASAVADVVLLDQDPLPRSARVNPATYLKVFDEIRTLFAETAEAKIRGFGAGHFSFNQPSGRCDACEGQGTLTVDMQFLADVSMTCPECQGSRFKKEILTVKVRNLDIAEVLNLTVREAFRFFRAQHGLQRKLKWLIDVGLEYVRLGQPTEALSGGECQRLRLAGHLASSRKPRTLFILVDPSAGLHPADTQRLLDCLDGLVQTGHSVIVIEHNLDVIKFADYVIDLGPGAGPAGGRVVAQGTPEEIARVAESATGRCIVDLISAKPPNEP